MDTSESDISTQKLHSGKKIMISFTIKVTSRPLRLQALHH